MTHSFNKCWYLFLLFLFWRRFLVTRFLYFCSEDDFGLLVFCVFFLFWRRFIIMTCCTDEYTSVSPLEIFILRGKSWNPINWFNNPATIVCLSKVEINTPKRFCYCDFYSWHFVTKGLCCCLLFCRISVFWFLLTFWIIWFQIKSMVLEILDL